MIQNERMLNMSENLLSCESNSYESIIDSYVKTSRVHDPLIVAAKNTLMLNMLYNNIQHKKKHDPVEGSCLKCRGTGIFKYQFQQVETTCYLCKGTGKKGEYRCGKCNGVGNVVNLTADVEKYIPCAECRGTGFDKKSSQDIMNKILANELSELVETNNMIDKVFE
jgi:hypothetical protein